MKEATGGEYSSHGKVSVLSGQASDVGQAAGLPREWQASGLPHVHARLNLRPAALVRERENAAA